MAWNCKLSAEEIAAWQRRYRVRLYAGAWQRWVLAVAIPQADSDRAAIDLAKAALRGYWGSPLPLVGRSGGERGAVSDMEITVHPEAWTWDPSGDELVNAIPESDRPTLMLGEPDAEGVRPKRMVWIQAAFVYRGGLTDGPWLAWDLAPTPAVLVGGVGWAPECPYEGDVTLVAAGKLSGRVVPSEDDADWSGLERIARAAAGVQAGMGWLGLGLGVLGLAWLLRNRR